MGYLLVRKVTAHIINFRPGWQFKAADYYLESILLDAYSDQKRGIRRMSMLPAKAMKYLGKLKNSPKIDVLIKWKKKIQYIQKSHAILLVLDIQWKKFLKKTQDYFQATDARNASLVKWVNLLRTDF